MRNTNIESDENESLVGCGPANEPTDNENLERTNQNNNYPAD